MLAGAEVAKDTNIVGGVYSDGGLYFGAGKTLDAASFFSGLIDKQENHIASTRLLWCRRLKPWCPEFLYRYKTLVSPGIGCGYLPSGPGRTGGSASQA